MPLRHEPHKDLLLRPLSIIARLYCGRRGITTMKALITFWTIAGTVLGGFTTWMGREAWREFSEVRTTLRNIELYMSADDARWRALHDNIVDLKADGRDLADRVNGIDVRLARQEGRR